MRELRHAVRVLLKSPLATSAAVLSLALGIGANTALFTTVNAILFKPLPGGVVNVYVSYPDGSRYGAASWAEYREYRKRSQSFEGLIAWNAETVHLTIDGSVERALGTAISTNYFAGLGIEPAPGRALRDGEESERIAVISHALWLEKFHGSVDAIGRPLQINDQTFTIVGVAPRGFWGLEADGATVWYPGAADSARMAGRLKPGVARGQAEGEMRVLAGDIEQGSHKGATITITPGSMVTPRDRMQIASIVGLIFAALGLVLTIACANVAILLLARAAGRRREIGIRIALGAGRARLIRQMLAESLVLALAAGAVGLLFSLWTAEIVRALQPPGDNPFAPNLAPDFRVVAFTFLLSLATGIAFGLVPALEASRSDVVGALKGTGAPQRSLWRAGLIAGQVALTTILLVSAGLLLRGFQKALTMDPGFVTDRILLVRLDLQLAGYDAGRAASFYRQLAASLDSVPSVRSASFAHVVPVGGRLKSIGITRDASERFRMASFNIVSPGYLRTMGLTLLAGREFTGRDDRAAPAVALINQTMASQFFPGEDPLGKNFFIDDRKIQVVGLVKDSRYLRLGEAPRPHFYRPLAQQPETQMTLLVATQGAPVAALPEIRGRVQALDPKLPILDAHSMAEQVRRSMFDSRNGAMLAASFGALALVLAAVGLYSVIAYWVSGRTREIGLRIALGAEQVNVRWMVVREGLRRVGVGLAVGAAGSIAAARILRKFLYGVSPADPVTWAGVALTLIAVALIATWAPAWRAARVEPLVALRHD